MEITSLPCIIALMIELIIPGRKTLRLEHLVCDVNGTLALEGQLIEGVLRKLHSLQDRLLIHAITADSYGKQVLIDRQLGLTAVRLDPGDESQQKKEFIQDLGADNVAAIGQGANDAGMLEIAGLGICILSSEGTAVETLLAADLVVPDILKALELFEKPGRIVATLRK